MASGIPTDDLIKEYAARLDETVRDLLPKNPNEAEFRRPLDNLLEEFCQRAGLNPLAHAEYTLATGRADAVFNRLVLEYERPGALSGDLSHPKTRHAVDQIKRYIEGLATRQRQEMGRIAGVAFDGRYLVFIRYREGDFSVEAPAPVSQASLERLLRWLASLASGIALTAENLSRDFSIEQPRTKNALAALIGGLDAALQQDTPMLRNLFQQWRLFFSESIDYSEAFAGSKVNELQKWAQRLGLTFTEPERFFFSLHTYFALLVKLIAWLALSRHLAIRLGAPSFGELVGADGDTLRRRLGEMESGGIFRAYGIANLLEGDFFAWYLYAWDDRIEGAIRELLQRLDEYDPATLAVVPEETRDLFKKLYHYLLPREVRHNLGEYYTPDWLAQRMLNQVDNRFFTADPRKDEEALRQKLLKLRWLDPACGSGTFPVLIIARMRELGRELMIGEAELLRTILSNVVGFDLNPLAVVTARVNYLLAIADLLPHRRGDLTLPIYLADSVLTPTIGEGLFANGNYEFPTGVGTFLVPEELCTKERFDRFCNLLEESIHSEIPSEAFLRRIEKALDLAPPGWTEDDAERVQKLYEEMLELHRNGMNGLWARLLKNNFAPLTVGQFDYIVGNPPWVNWEHLPDGYRNSTRPLWATYRLAGTFAGGRPRLGAVKVDLSVLMTYVVVDKLLKPGGRLGFIITQSVFKTAAGAGFRRFSIPGANGKSTPLRVVHVDDMVSLQPFEGASNRTAAFVLEKGKPTAYPVPYTLWRKVKGARFTYDSTLEEVTAATRRLNLVAEPVNSEDPTSPWLTARPKALQAIRKVLGRSDYEAHEGVNTGGANAVYWVEIVLKRPDGLVVVRNITEGAKVKVEEVIEPIEPDLLYPLLRGRDVQRWRAEPSAWILVPQDPENPTRAYPERRLQSDYPRTYGYLKRFEKALRNRSGFRQILSKREGEFYGVMDIGAYTFAPWKVVWREQARTMTASVIGPSDGKPVVPDHKLMLIDCENEKEAHFVCACLNSRIGQFATLSYAVEIQIGPHILERIRIPRFDPKNPVHLGLAELSEQAHGAAKAGDVDRLRKIEGEVDLEAAKLWGLSEEELREIQRSLAELGTA